MEIVTNETPVPMNILKRWSLTGCRWNERKEVVDAQKETVELAMNQCEEVPCVQATPHHKLVVMELNPIFLELVMPKCILQL